MFFYPDQFYYEPYQGSSSQPKQRAAPSRGAASAQPERSFYPQAFGSQGGYPVVSPFGGNSFGGSYGGQPLFFTTADDSEPEAPKKSHRPHHHKHHNHHHHNRRAQPNPSPFGGFNFVGGSSPFGGSNEYYIIQDEDELEALQAYREKKNREAELLQRRREALIRQQEAERVARERAEQVERERRLRAAAEQNARAAARAYIRRKQAQQAALLQAEYEEKRQRQQDALEKLLNPFVVRRDSVPFFAQGNEQEQEQAGEDNVNNNEQAPEQEQKSVEQDEQEDSQARAQDEAKQYIQLLVDSLAPSLLRVVDPSESSEEDDGETAETAGTAGTARTAERNVEDDGPHCETASEGSGDEGSDASVSELDPQARPPHADGEESDVEQEEQDEPFTEEPFTEEPSIDDADPVVVIPFTELASKQEKRQKNNVNNTQPKKTRRRSPQASATDSTPEKTIKQLKEWKLKLDSIKEGEKAFKSYPEDPAVISALKKRAQSLIQKTEAIYENLDGLRVAKDCRKLKHDLTSDAVALADKLELALLRLNAVEPVTPKYHVTLEDVPDEDSN